MDEALNAFTTDMNESVVKEGAVLLKNDGALPLNKQSEAVSVFGMSSTLWMTLDKIKTAKDAVFANALEDYGFKVNGTLRAFYNRSSHTDWGIGDNKGDGSSAGSWKIDEVPQSEYTAAKAQTCPGIWTGSAARPTSITLNFLKTKRICLKQ